MIPFLLGFFSVAVSAFFSTLFSRFAFRPPFCTVREKLFCAEKAKSPSAKSARTASAKYFAVFDTRKLFDVELLLELINTTACIHKLLFAGEERMTLRAYINAQIVLGGSGYESLAASALNRYFLVFRMEIFLHVSYPPLRFKNRHPAAKVHDTPTAFIQRLLL